MGRLSYIKQEKLFEQDDIFLSFIFSITIALKGQNEENVCVELWRKTRDR